jgi:DNA-binding transcriptional LysR family regulator
VDLAGLRVFLAIASERSFSRAASRLYRTQPAVSQAIRRLESELNERLIDRSTKNGTLTEAGHLLEKYGRRVVQLADEAEAAVREMRAVRRGRVLVGTNAAGVHTLLPIVERFRAAHPEFAIELRRVHARDAAAMVLSGRLEFGLQTFAPSERALSAVAVGIDELVVLLHPGHALAGQRRISMAEFARQPIVEHNEPSPARERVLRLFEERRLPLVIVVAMPSLDAIKAAVEMRLGIALLPSRCAVSEIAAGRLAAVPLAGVSRRRTVSLVYDRDRLSHAGRAFLNAVEACVQGDKGPAAGRNRRLVSLATAQRLDVVEHAGGGHRGPCS